MFPDPDDDVPVPEPVPPVGDPTHPPTSEPAAISPATGQLIRSKATNV